jgi:Amt family ammonium transporter
MTFAVITPALIIGACPERMRFGSVVAFSGLWLLVVYAPVTHWVWGGGWLGQRHVMDFAGGLVVHATAGVSALLFAHVVGPRDGFPRELRPPHNPGMTMMGAGMLWVGWYGFNAGSALAADADAGMALVATHLSASAAGLTWACLEWKRFGRPSMVGMVTGVVAGLATITPASGYVGPVAALIIGGVAGVLCQEVVLLVKKRVDDTLDVFAVHGVGGIFGTIMVAVFGAGSWAAQLGGLAVVAIWTIVLTLILIKICALVTPLRVDAETEANGLDLSVHGERGYDLNS